MISSATERTTDNAKMMKTKSMLERKGTKKNLGKMMTASSESLMKDASAMKKKSHHKSPTRKKKQSEVSPEK